MVKSKKNFLRSPLFLVLLCAGLSVFGLSLARQTQEATQSVAVDFDQDGLSNEEEALYGTDPDARDSDRDGYSDGVEVRSGYDPLVSAIKGDRVAGAADAEKVRASGRVAARNLTAEFNTRVAGIAVDIMNGKTVTMDDLEKEVRAVVGDDNALKDLPPMDVSKIRIKKQQYDHLSKAQRTQRLHEDAANYLTAISYVVSVHMPDIAQPDRAQALFAQALGYVSGAGQKAVNITYFKEMLPDGDKLLADLEAIEVPEALLAIHVEGIQIARAVILIVDRLDEQLIADDPVAFVKDVSQLQAVFILVNDFNRRINAAFEEYGIVLGTAGESSDILTTPSDEVQDAQKDSVGDDNTDPAEDTVRVSVEEE